MSLFRDAARAVALAAADIIFPPAEDALHVRSLTKDDVRGWADPRMLDALEYPAISLLPYAHSGVRACILEAKFNSSEKAAGLAGSVLGEWLHEVFAEWRTLDPFPPRILPIPLSLARLKERGYNQAERIVRHALAGSHSTYISMDTLTRVRNTPPQTSQGGESRRKNLIHAFSAVPCDPERTYILVDDVVTTGSTFAAAAHALRQAGARRIIAIALAH